MEQFFFFLQIIMLLETEERKQRDGYKYRTEH